MNLGRVISMSHAIALTCLAMSLTLACISEPFEDAKRFEIDLADSPTRGTNTPSVVLVEFIDIECPYCATGARTSNELIERYPDVLQIVFKHFPVPAIHAQALSAAIATECAREQDRFWEMLDRLVTPEALLSDHALFDHAESIGLDTSAFQDCLVTKPSVDRIQRDRDQGSTLGVQATPTFFLNGRRIVGLRSIEDFCTLIDQELKQELKNQDTESDSQDADEL